MTPEIRLTEGGFKSLVHMARDGYLDLPDDIMEAWAAFEEAAEQYPREEKLLAILEGKFMRCYVQHNREDLIRDGLQPKFNSFVREIADDIATIGRYATEVTIPVGVLSEPDDVRAAYVRFTEFYPRYMMYRQAWRLLVGADNPDRPDPWGVRSMLCEVRNIADIVGDWQTRIGNGSWPWHANHPGVRFTWILNHGGQFWCPTPSEWDEAWRQQSKTRAA